MQLLRIGGLRIRNGSAAPIVLLVAVLHITLLLPYLSNASDPDLIVREDLAYPRSSDLQSKLRGSWVDDREPEVDDYLPDFPGFDRSIIGRVDDGTQLRNNVPGKKNIAAGDSQTYTFSKVDLQGSQPSTPSSRVVERSIEESSEPHELSEGWQAGLQNRQTDIPTLYVTLSICDQPASTLKIPNGAPPPLQLYISTDAQNPKPDGKNNNGAVPVVNGLGSYTLQTADDVFFTVTAPSESTDFDGPYSYELTASTDKPYTSYNASLEMHLVDSDSNSALLSTDKDISPASYDLFVQDRQNPTIWGLQNSSCGLKNHAQILANTNSSAPGDVSVEWTSSSGDPPRKFFYVKKLNSSSAYSAIMAIAGDPTTAKAGSGVAGGGGTVLKAVNFTTKSTDNCAVIFNLSFCSDVAYAVPSNPQKYNTTALTLQYDNFASALYQNFNKSLQQIPCNTTNSAQYSLVRNCTSCANAYKTWLCAVTIPRCEAFSNNASYLQARAINYTFPNGTAPPPFTVANKSAAFMNESRNPWIDQQITPGPYKEVLPCIGLCYDLVQSCPASLGFACPLEGRGLDHSYGINRSTGGEPTCNYPAFGKVSVASGVPGKVWLMAMALLVGLSAGM